ncbi:hypothetical protein BFT35_12965 [Thermoanaerobacterium thermosaccharolyticum]|uniref:DUF6470 family protein n=1 Tax=Thermoanaerobacterium TaxID=28895 RepID=UPI000C07DFF4|nr:MULTISPECIES: DUF6470 family protein [Thermoanaerobacterium]MDN5316902.1 hypothetical protein [Thermoanaerobacterium sp.]PHO06110.1 hypothetical protein BFT35_12965 [Thermoanaerobacterium thermosaccharolyticum]WKV09855.1 DUF6470 family protein [Thermoanaerobacterium sp. CMT5567-10]
MDIVINQTFGRIGIDTTPAVINIHNQNADLNIHQEMLKVEIEQKLPQVHIDQYQCFYESGLKSVFDLIHDEAERSYQVGLEAIAKIVDDGNALASIENHQNVIPQLAFEAGVENIDFNVDLMPKSRPKIWFDGYLNINWQKGNVSVNVKPQKPEIYATRANVNIYMLQYPSIKIDYIGQNVDTIV